MHCHERQLPVEEFELHQSPLHQAQSYRAGAPAWGLPDSDKCYCMTGSYEGKKGST